MNARTHPNVEKLFRFSRDAIARASAALLADPARLERDIIVVFDPWDEEAGRVYMRLATIPGSSLPPYLEEGAVRTIGVNYAGFLELVREHYDVTDHRDFPREPNQLRLAFLTNETLYIRVLQSDSFEKPRGTVRSRGGSG